MKTIELTRGYVAMVDDADYEWLSKFKWYASAQTKRGEPYTPAVSRTQGIMHRLIMGLEKGDKRVVDHIDSNPLNNQRANLRICSVKENNQNKRVSLKNTSGAKGVYWNKTAQRWVAQISDNRKKYFLGYFTEKLDAAAAYAEAAKKYHGEFAHPG